MRICPQCEKWFYPSRKAARRAARALYPHEALRAYRCGDLWHVGNTPLWIKQGKKRSRR